MQAQILQAGEAPSDPQTNNKLEELKTTIPFASGESNPQLQEQLRNKP